MGGHRNQYIRESHNKRGRAWTDYRFKVEVEGGRGWGSGVLVEKRVVVHVHHKYNGLYIKDLVS